MDSVQIFDDELQSLFDSKPPVSKAKMGLITRAAMKGVKFYKHIVLCVEKFIAKCHPEYKVPGLYVIDSIVRQSRHQFGADRDVYALRFSRNLQITFENLFSGCLPEDRPKIVRVLNLWLKNNVFCAQTIQPLLGMSATSPRSSVNQASLSASSPPAEANQSSNYLHMSSSERHQKSGETSLKFSKNMLDFDYGEDEDDGDETPTEAEPPLSSTLNKIEMEQRGHANNNLDYKSTSQTQSYNTNYHQPDPVLERWNRIIRGEIADDLVKDRINRSRSRSPPQTSLLKSKHNVNSRSARDFVYKPPPSVQTKEETEQTGKISMKNPIKNAEKEAERKKKCLPEIRDKHLTVCSSTLWLGHVPKTVSEADLSNAFGEYGSITSIDLIPPRGCAYICMDRRQDAKKALSESKDLKLSGSHIKMAWAPGKGFKEYKRLKDFWEVETGTSYIPYSKIDDSIDFDVLEEGGVIDEDSMSMEMRDMRNRKLREIKSREEAINEPKTQVLPLPVMPLMGQPPPTTSLASFNIPAANLAIPPPSALSQGMIHYPPPSVPLIRQPNSNANMTNHTAMPNLDETNDVPGRNKSPSSIDQQLSMTEHQINMVSQQLNMIKQAQNMAGTQNVSQANHMPPMQPPPIFNPQHNQHNPMIFDVPLQNPFIPGGQSILDPNIFVNPTQLLCQPPPMLPISQPAMIPPTNMHGGMLPHNQGRY